MNGNASHAVRGEDTRYWRENALEQARTNARLRIEIQRLRGELEDMAKLSVLVAERAGTDRRWDVV